MAKLNGSEQEILKDFVERVEAKRKWHGHKAPDFASQLGIHEWTWRSRRNKPENITALEIVRIYKLYGLTINF
jgi:sugar diacid utilization regulator